MLSIFMLLVLFKNSGKLANTRDAREIFSFIVIPEDLVKDFIIGNNERVAKAGASSVLV